MARSSIRWVRLLGALCALACHGAALAEGVSSERSDQLKAAYLFNFVQFVDWPADVSDALQICFAGAPGVHDSLEAAASGKRVGERALQVRTLGKGDAVDKCAVIYFEHPDAALLQSARNSALTVSETNGFTHQGGVIQLFTQNNRLRFIVNIENAKRARLRISSNLLKLASSVEQEPAP